MEAPRVTARSPWHGCQSLVTRGNGEAAGCGRGGEGVPWSGGWVVKPPHDMPGLRIGPADDGVRWNTQRRRLEADH